MGWCVLSPEIIFIGNKLFLHSKKHENSAPRLIASPTARDVWVVLRAKLHAFMDDLGGEIWSMKKFDSFYPRWLTTAYAAAYYLTCRLVVHCIYSGEKLDLRLAPSGNALWGWVPHLPFFSVKHLLLLPPSFTASSLLFKEDGEQDRRASLFSLCFSDTSCCTVYDASWEEMGRREWKKKKSPPTFSGGM